MNLRPLPVLIAACAVSASVSVSSAAFAGENPLPSSSSKSTSADWVLSLDSAAVSGPLSPALLGQYDLSGALYRFDEVPGLAAGMKAAGFAEWRVGLGRWEFATQLLPALTDGTPCSELASDPAAAFAPAGTTDLDLIRARDWFADTDGAPVTAAMTADDARYRLDYIRSVLDVASAFGAAPFVDIDLMPRALAANRTPVRSTADWTDPCGTTWTNRVSNARPADPAVFAEAAAGLVRRVVEGSGGEPGRPVRYWEVWNEADAGYAWDPVVGDFHSYLETAASTLVALDAYRRATADPNGRAIRIGLGGFASASTAIAVLPILDVAGVPFDFISFHAESSDDPLFVAAQIRQVASAVRASSNPGAEVLVTEWSANLGGSTLDPNTMDLPLFDATFVALGASAGVTHMHHAIFWDYFGEGSPGLGILGHDGSPKPAYRAFAMLADVVGAGSIRLAPPESPDGLLDGGAGAVLASRDPEGRIHVLYVNRGNTAKSASVGVMPTAVTVFDDPSRPPRSVTPSAVVTVPARSLVLVERPAAAGPVGRQAVILPAPRRRHAGASDAQIVFEAPGIPGDGNIQEIFTMNVDGSQLTQVTHDGLSKFLPHFSPDATRLVYTKFFVGQYAAPDAQTDVVVYRFATGTETRLTVTGTAFQPVWSPDGSRIAYGSITGDSLWIMDADGANAHLVGGPSGAGDDMRWNDFAWSQDDWILFTVGQIADGCFKVRLDKIRPDGSARTQVTDGGPNCTTPGKEQSGDADPGFSADGRTIFSSRGFPNAPPGFPASVVRRLYSFSSGAWTPGKTENDLSLPVRRDCIEGVPKGSPDGTRVLLFRACQGEPHIGVTLTDNAGSYRTWLVDGFGADWNPVAGN